MYVYYNHYFMEYNIKNQIPLKYLIEKYNMYMYVYSTELYFNHRLDRK